MEDTRTFTEVFAVVKYKLEHKLPMMTAKEESMEDFIKEWSEMKELRKELKKLR